MEIIEKVVTENEEGKRFDAVVSILNEKISRTLAQELIKEGTILLDGVKAKGTAKVRVGQVIAMPNEYNTKPAENLVAEDIDIDILYEDEDIIVVNKPKDMVVHPAVGNWTGTLVNAMLGKHELSDENGEFRPGIVHRLDKNTTGVMVVAKNNNAHNVLSKQIQEHSFKKI